MMPFIVLFLPFAKTIPEKPIFLTQKNTFFDRKNQIFFTLLSQGAEILCRRAKIKIERAAGKKGFDVVNGNKNQAYCVI
ncbi:MAG: hypothetical protein IJ250_07920 [Bacteroidales bacterium]|nr:hypothetical protein [Bacteroidales bacterium]